MVWLVSGVDRGGNFVGLLDRYVAMSLAHY